MKLDTVSEARKIVVGKTWLNVLLMQGSELIVHSMKRKHYCTIGKNVVTDEHQSEAGLAFEMMEEHNIRFVDLKYVGVEGDDSHYKFKWIMK